MSTATESILSARATREGTSQPSQPEAGVSDSNSTPTEKEVFPPSSLVPAQIGGISEAHPASSSTQGQTSGATAPAISSVGVVVVTEPKPAMSLVDFLKNSKPAAVSLAGLPSPAAIPGSGGISSALVGSSARPFGITLGNTKNLTKGYLHALIYGETDARKTSTAATFSDPEHTRIIIVRRPEQLRPLRNLGYEYAHIEEADALKYALLNPEELWPDWAKLEDRVLVLDDFTRAKDMLLDANETRTDEKGNVKAVRDARQIHKAAKDDLYDIMQIVFKRPQHFIGTALAQIYDNKITHEETLSPDIPPSMARMLTTEFEFVFFIDKKTWRFVTTQKLEAYKAKNDKGYEETHNRFIFAKHKLPIELEGKNLMFQDEEMDLRYLWRVVQEEHR